MDDRLHNPDAITLEMLSPAQREVAEVIGLENYIRLAHFVNGDTLYIPKYTGLVEDSERRARDDEIISRFDGFNYKELAQEYQLTPRTLYNIIPRSVRNARRSGPMDGQVSLAQWALAGKDEV